MPRSSVFSACLMRRFDDDGPPRPMQAAASDTARHDSVNGSVDLRESPPIHCFRSSRPPRRPLRVHLPSRRKPFSSRTSSQAVSSVTEGSLAAQALCDHIQRVPRHAEGRQRNEQLRGCRVGVEGHAKCVDRSNHFEEIVQGLSDSVEASSSGDTPYRRITTPRFPLAGSSCPRHDRPPSSTRRQFLLRRRKLRSAHSTTPAIEVGSTQYRKLRYRRAETARLVAQMLLPTRPRPAS